MLLTGSAQDENNPVHLWTGLCATPCAVALRDRNNYGDLTGLARIRWVTKTSGFHLVRPIVKLADGTWLVGDHTDGSTIEVVAQRMENPCEELSAQIACTSYGPRLLGTNADGSLKSKSVTTMSQMMKSAVAMTR